MPVSELAETMTATQARILILSGMFVPDMLVKGSLNLAGTTISALPEGLEVQTLNLAGCKDLGFLPEGLKVRHLILKDCSSLKELPRGLKCQELELQRTNITTLPDDLRVEHSLDLEDCFNLTRLPAGLKVGTLNLRGCSGLKSLPEGLEVNFLDVSGCVELGDWPRKAKVQFGWLRARECAQFTRLPDWLFDLAQLDLRGCSGISALPANLKVTSWIDLAGTRVKKLPEGCAKTALLWKGIEVDARIILQPETITANEILTETNVERRRVLLERMTFERFLGEAEGVVYHQDRDRGGVRQLVRVPLLNDEPLVCLVVHCPSTGHQHILRVPPTMQTCHQAAAWIAGFDNPDDYQPVQET